MFLAVNVRELLIMWCRVSVLTRTSTEFLQLFLARLMPVKLLRFEAVFFYAKNI